MVAKGIPSRSEYLAIGKHTSKEEKVVQKCREPQTTAA
jgi:hypothetical protein